MSLGARRDLVHIALVDHIEMFGRQGCAELRADALVPQKSTISAPTFSG
jgi:hypothetical protein